MWKLDVKVQYKPLYIVHRKYFLVIWECLLPKKLNWNRIGRSRYWENCRLPLTLTIHLMMVWCYDGLEKSDLGSYDYHTIPTIMWSQFECLGTSMHLWWLQHLAVIWSWFATFPSFFWQAKSIGEAGFTWWPCDSLNDSDLLNNHGKNGHEIGSSPMMTSFSTRPNNDRNNGSNFDHKSRTVCYLQILYKLNSSPKFYFFLLGAENQNIILSNY